MVRDYSYILSVNNWATSFTRYPIGKPLIVCARPKALMHDPINRHIDPLYFFGSCNIATL